MKKSSQMKSVLSKKRWNVIDTINYIYSVCHTPTAISKILSLCKESEDAPTEKIVSNCIQHAENILLKEMFVLYLHALKGNKKVRSRQKQSQRNASHSQAITNPPFEGPKQSVFFQTPCQYSNRKRLKYLKKLLNF